MSSTVVLLPEDADDITKYDERKHKRHFRGWLSYAFARCARDRTAAGKKLLTFSLHAAVRYS